MNRLMLGSGKHRRDGWLTLDANPKLEPDFCAVIPPLPPDVKVIAWDEIEWIHGITSLYPWDAEAVLKELHSVLALRGKLVLEQPNFYKAVHNVEWLFGDPSLGNPMHMNRWSWTPESLVRALSRAGFKKVDMLPARHHMPERDFRIEAYR